MRQILLITLGLSTALFASFSKSGNIVTDSTTGLQWQDDAISAQMNWASAIDYCENLTLDGQSDWRLPNIRELASLIDDSRANLAIYPVFSNTASHHYWSSTTANRSDYSSYAWRVFFYDGGQNYLPKDFSYYVRCVRVGE